MYLNSIHFNGCYFIFLIQKVVVIPGNSRGIGAATAKLFAQNGFSACIDYKSNVEAAQALVEDIKVLGGHVFLFKMMPPKKMMFFNWLKLLIESLVLFLLS